MAPAALGGRAFSSRVEAAGQALPQQDSLFPAGPEPRERLRLVDGARSAGARRDAILRAAPAAISRTPGSREHHQQRLSFPQPQPDHPASDSTIYCDAGVALPVHRIMGAMLDGSMMLIGIGIFLMIFHAAGAKIVLNKATLPYYGAAAFATLTLYRLLWCVAGTDSIGMRWSGLRLITFDGVLPTRQQRFLRLVSALISIMPGGLGLFWGLVDEEKLTWHDHMSKTFPTPGKHLMRSSAR
ncbi:MAG TPA: RDD family protein [Bryobacteraceae bacterium]|nr:RDD family protein [Bryobacteraceae bacterium]